MRSMYLMFALNGKITEEVHAHHFRPQLQDYTGGPCTLGTEDYRGSLCTLCSYLKDYRGNPGTPRTEKLQRRPMYL